MTATTAAAPAIVRAGSLPDSIHVEPLTHAIGAELSNINLGVASREPALVAEIRRLLLRHRVLFFRDQDITRAEHVAFARHFGELESHPVAGSDPDHPGLVRIYKSPDTPNDRYENAWHTDATWREKPPFGCVLRCVECPPVGGDTMWANMALAYERLPEHVKGGACAWLDHAQNRQIQLGAQDFDGDGAHRRTMDLSVGDRAPGHATVGRLPQTAAGCAHVVLVRPRDAAGDAERSAAARRPQAAPAQRAKRTGAFGRRGAAAALRLERHGREQKQNA